MFFKLRVPYFPENRKTVSTYDLFYIILLRLCKLLHFSPILVHLHKFIFSNIHGVSLEAIY